MREGAKRAALEEGRLSSLSEEEAGEGGGKNEEEAGE